jgi:hypothetical protein
MSLATQFPALLEMFVSFLLPLLLPAAGGDHAAARAAALELLAEYHPRTARELDLAAEAVANSLKSLTMLAQSAEPGLSQAALNDTLKWATSLSREGHRAQRRLDQMQRARRAAAKGELAAQIESASLVEPAALLETVAIPAVADLPQIAPDATLTDVTQTEATPVDPAQPEPAPAETALARAEKLLALMKAHHKGAPAPHTKAAQQIRDQQRVVDAARLTLAQARRRQAEGQASPEAFAAAA